MTDELPGRLTIADLTSDAATAAALDAADPLADAREQFHIPPGADGAPQTYLVGNSLGPVPVRTAAYVNTELTRWADLGVAGHTTGELAWGPYHELLTDQCASIVGGLAEEVVVMNALTVNLHMLMISFYNPTAERHKILIEGRPVTAPTRWNGRTSWPPSPSTATSLR